MTSEMHQMMSQGNQVVETTPGHSQELFTASETFNLRENSEAHITGNTMMQKTILWAPC